MDVPIDVIESNDPDGPFRPPGDRATTRRGASFGVLLSVSLVRDEHGHEHLQIQQVEAASGPTWSDGAAFGDDHSEVDLLEYATSSAVPPRGGRHGVRA